MNRFEQLETKRRELNAEAVGLLRHLTERNAPPGVDDLIRRLDANDAAWKALVEECDEPGCEVDATAFADGENWCLDHLDQDEHGYFSDEETHIRRPYFEETWCGLETAVVTTGPHQATCHFCRISGYLYELVFDQVGPEWRLRIIERRPEATWARTLPACIPSEATKEQARKTTRKNPKCTQDACAPRGDRTWFDIRLSHGTQDFSVRATVSVTHKSPRLAVVSATGTNTGKHALLSFLLAALFDKIDERGNPKLQALRNAKLTLFNEALLYLRDLAGEKAHPSLVDLVARMNAVDALWEKEMERVFASVKREAGA